MGCALDAAGIKVTKIDFDKKRPVWISGRSNAMSMEHFAELMRGRLGKELRNHAAVGDAILDADMTALADLLTKHGEQVGLIGEAKLPDGYAGLKINLDLSSKRELKFFVSNEKELISPITGAIYIATAGLKIPEAVGMARQVFPEYHPRGPRGVFPKKFENGETHDVFNTYIPPTWEDHPEYKKKAEKIPPLFKKLFLHLFPDKRERSFFYGWAYRSLYDRAPTYLVLCGKGGIGKNRLKNLMRALHGHTNTTDGKESTLTEKFNTQLIGATLIWFDELNYGGGKAENSLKEMQNETMPIESKGVDTTNSTPIYASMVIVNNNYRDNHISFDARKFAPLQMTEFTMLDAGWKQEEIDEITRMTEKQGHPDFDPGALAQFAKWLQKHGKEYAKQFPNMEYKGPMFYHLANTSMSRWQAVAVETLAGMDKKATSRIVYVDGLGFRWSSIERHLRKNKDNRLGSFEPNYSLVKSFFEIFRDAKGRKAFSTTDVPESHTRDFYVDPILEKIATVKEKNDDDESEYLDL